MAGDNYPDEVRAWLALLAELAPAWLVAVMPDDPASYHLTHPVGALLLQYGGSRYSQQDNIEGAQTERAVVWGIRIVAYGQWGDQGALAD